LLIFSAAALHEFCALRPKNAFWPVKACRTPAVSAKLPPLALVLALPLADPLAAGAPPALAELAELHPAATRQAVATTAQAASRRRFLSIIARPPSPMHRNVAGHLLYTSQCDAQAEALACTYIAVDR
jgi:hypothetical protein